MKLPFVTPASLALTATALAQSDAQWVVGGRNPATGPANATGVSTFRGPDLSVPDGGSDIEHEVSVAVYAEVSANATQPGQRFAVSVITLRGANGREADSGWSVCVNVWEAGPDVSQGGNLGDPGDCSVALSEACRGGFPSFYERDECGFPLDLRGGECEQFLGSGIATPREIGDPTPVSVYWSAPFDPANQAALMEAYATEVDKVWIVQVLWSRAEGPDGSTARVSGPVCLQASHIAEGSADPSDQDDESEGEEGDNGAEQQGVRALASWGAAAAFVLLLFA